MSTKQLTAERATGATHDHAQLGRQYGSDVIPFAEKDSDLYERHILFDHVVAIESATPRERFEAFTRVIRDVLSRRWIKMEETYVLQFAFDGHSDNPYPPNNYVPNTVVYTGTHDNPPSRAWYEELSGEQRENLWRYLQSAPADSRDVAWNLVRLAWSSVAALAVAPLQDLLNLGPEGRMNIPGRADGNWAWLCSDEMLSGPSLGPLLEMTQASNRVCRG